MILRETSASYIRANMRVYVIYIKISGLSKNEIPLISDNYTNRKSIKLFEEFQERLFLSLQRTTKYQPSYSTMHFQLNRNIEETI